MIPSMTNTCFEKGERMNVQKKQLDMRLRKEVGANGDSC